MAAIVDTNILNTVAQMGLAVLRESIQLVKRTNREYERALVGATPNSTVNIIVPAAITAVAVSPAQIHPNNTAAVTPTKVAVTLDQWYRAAFDFTDKQAMQVDRGIIPMQIQEAVRGLVNTIEANVWLNYKKAYGYAGLAGTTPFATDVSEFLTAEKVGNDQLMPGDRRFLLLDTAANANWRGLRRNYDRNFDPIGVDTAWTQHVPTHTAGTASGATTDAAGYAVGIKTVTLASAGTGTIVVGDVITFAGDTQTYVVTAGDTDVSNGGSVSFEPGLKVAITTATTAITVKASHVVNLYGHPNAIAFAMAPMIGGLNVGAGTRRESVAVDPDSGLGLRLTVFEGFYQTEWSFDALWGSAVPRPELLVRIAG